MSESSGKGKPTPRAPQNQRGPKIPGALITAFPIALEVSSGAHKQLGACQVLDFDLTGGGRLRLVVQLGLVEHLTAAMLEGKTIAEAQAASGDLAVVESKLWTPNGATD